MCLNGLKNRSVNLSRWINLSVDLGETPIFHFVIDVDDPSDYDAQWGRQFVHICAFQGTQNCVTKRPISLNSDDRVSDSCSQYNLIDPLQKIIAFAKSSSELLANSNWFIKPSYYINVLQSSILIIP